MTSIHRAASQNTKVLAKFLVSFYGSKHVSIKIGHRAESFNTFLQEGSLTLKYIDITFSKLISGI